MSFFDPDTNELAGAVCMQVDVVLSGKHGAAFRAPVDAQWASFLSRKMERKRRIILRQLDRAKCHHKQDHSVTEFTCPLGTKAKPEEKATVFEIKSRHECSGAPERLTKRGSTIVGGARAHVATCTQ